MSCLITPVSDASGSVNWKDVNLFEGLGLVMSLEGGAMD